MQSLAVLSLATLLSGCCTSAVWNPDGRSDPDPIVAEQQTTSAGGDDADDGDDVELRVTQVVLTPVAVVIDAVTLPLQLLGYWLFWPTC